MIKPKEKEKNEASKTIDEIEKEIDNMPIGFIRQEDANFYRFEKIGSNVLGKLMGIDKSERYGFNIYNILNKATNELIRCHGSKDLDTKMSGVEIGDTVYIEYIDNLDVPNGTMKVFSVGIAPKK